MLFVVIGVIECWVTPSASKYKNWYNAGPFLTVHELADNTNWVINDYPLLGVTLIEPPYGLTGILTE